MKHLLLAGLLAASAAGLPAAQHADAASPRPIKQTIQTASPSGKINISRFKHAVRKEAGTLPECFALYESFEGWDGTDPEWTPEGWTVDMRGEVERADSWTPAAAQGMLQPSDGRSMYGINYSSKKQDEWLISPEVTVEEGMILSYYVYLTPLYLYNVDNINWETGEFEGGKTVASTLQVWAQAEGEEWVMLHDFADDYMDEDVSGLYAAQFTELERRTESLARFAGKKVKVAFRVTGIDGDTMFIDEIGVGLPALEGVSYMEPYSTLYWGFDRSSEMAGLQADIAMHPVYEPITWMNMMDDETAEFTWTYTDPETGRAATSNNRSELTLTFYPDYTNEETKRNNFFLPPMLTATAPMATPASYQAPYAYFQAGGKPERTLQDGTEFAPTLLPFGYNASGLTAVMIDDSKIGDMALPVFGHNANTDRYWLNYSLNGEEAIEGNYSHLEGIANLLMPTAAPLVVRGVNVYGNGRFAKDARFAVTIYGVNEEMSRDFSTLTVIATDTITGAEVLGLDENMTNTLCLPFDFDEPVVVKATEEHPAYFIMFSGFRSDKVEYFAPYQSAVPDPNNICWGYILNEICLNGQGALAGDEPYMSLKPMVYKLDGKYVDPYAAFAIGLNAEYPWLTTDCEGLSLGAEESEATAALGSYYDGSQLTVEVPEGLSATVEGRYDECVLKVSRDGFKAVDGSVTVKGLGVEVTIPVKAEEAGIADVSADGNARVTDVYDLSGRRVSAPAKGIYLLKSSDGTVRKSLCR